MALREISHTEAVSRSQEFLRLIGRKDLEQIIKPETPLLYVSPEFALDLIGPSQGRLGYAGGLGILSGDHVLQLAQTGLPAEAVGLLHTRRLKPVLSPANWQDDVPIDILSPEELGLQKRSELQVAVAVNRDLIKLDVYDLPIGGQTTLHLLHVNGLGEVYPGQPKDDHRMYQTVVLGFGGWQIMEQTKKKPAKLHLNESSTALMALAMWDSAMQHLLDEGLAEDETFAQSLNFVRNKTILTNHTLIPAAEAAYSSAQYENYVLRNIQSPRIKQQLRELITYNGGQMRILDLGMYLAGSFNGVSALHARLATETFKKMYGELLDGNRPMFFQDVTNAIDYRWYEKTHELYKNAGVLDEFDLPTSDFADKISAIDSQLLREIKDFDKANLRVFLKNATLGNNDTEPTEQRKPLDLPEDAIVIGWARRFADYKRPGMMIEDLARIKQILKKHPNVHIVYSGKTHPTDDPMKMKLQEILNRIQNDEVLRQRVHFVQDYDIQVGKALTAGADIWVNNPRVGEEACGTSIFKAVANNGLLVSTPDGGAADVDESAYLAIKSPNELDSLYDRIEEAISLVQNTDAWAEKVKSQLRAFIPIIAGGRMITDYLNFSFNL